MTDSTREFTRLLDRLCFAWRAEQAAVARHGHSDLGSDRETIQDARIQRIAAEREVHRFITDSMGKNNDTL